MQEGGVGAADTQLLPHNISQPWRSCGTGCSLISRGVGHGNCAATAAAAVDLGSGIDFDTNMDTTVRKYNVCNILGVRITIRSR